MFEIIINLILTSLFLQFQAGQQLVAPVEGLASRLPEAQLRQLIETAPQKKPDASLGVEVTAESVLVVDKKTNKILYEKNSGQARSIASLTKLMTALVFLDHNPGWDEVVTISGDDYREGGISYFIAGEQVTVKDLFYGTLVASANEGAAALVRVTGMNPEEFVAQMNAKAQALGLTNTVFADATGLRDANQSTAAEVAVVLRAALGRPEIAGAISSESYNIDIINKGVSRQIVNTNKILGQQFGLDNIQYWVEAGKTGYLEAAGYCLASQVKNGDNKVLVVVLGSKSLQDRFTDTKSLAYWVFNNYFWQ